MPITTCTAWLAVGPGHEDRRRPAPTALAGASPRRRGPPAPLARPRPCHRGARALPAAPLGRRPAAAASAGRAAGACAWRTARVSTLAGAACAAPAPPGRPAGAGPRRSAAVGPPAACRPPAARAAPGARRFRRAEPRSPRAGTAAPRPARAARSRPCGPARTPSPSCPAAAAGSRCSTATMALYVTTFDTVVGLSRTCSTRPQKSRSGNASTWKRTSWPSRTRPTSASSIEAFTRICDRSFAITKSVGRLEGRGHRLADVDAARDHDAVDRRVDDGVAEVELGLVDGGHRLAHRRLGRLHRGDRAVVVRLRRVEVALRHELLRRPARARARTCAACPRPSPSRGRRSRGRPRGSPRAWPSRASKIDGSSRAMTWPFFTCELKSA